MDSHHPNNFWVDAFRDHAPLRRNVLQHLIEGLRFDLLAVQLATRVIKVKYDATLLQLADEQIGAVVWADICEA